MTLISNMLYINRRKTKYKVLRKRMKTKNSVWFLNLNVFNQFSNVRLSLDFDVNIFDIYRSIVCIDAFLFFDILLLNML